MKFGQLVEHHMRNVLLEKSLKNQNSGYIWINILNFNSVGFIASPSRQIPKYMVTNVLITCFHPL